MYDHEEPEEEGGDSENEREHGDKPHPAATTPERVPPDHGTDKRYQTQHLEYKQ